MARKRRRKPTAKVKKKSTTARKKRKTVKRKARTAARRAKPKGVIARIVGAAEAVADTLADAERLHHKLEPHVPPDLE